MRRLRLLPLAASLLVFASLASAKSPPAPTETLVVPTGKGPCGTTVAAGHLWVGVYETGALLEIDPKRSRVVRRIAAGRWACRVAIAGGAAWVTRDRAGVVARIDLRTGRKRELRLGAAPFDVVVAAGSIWVTSFDVGTIARLDLRGKLRRVYRDGPNPAGIASCGGRIWVGHGREATALTSIDPRTNRMRRIDVGVEAAGWPRCVRNELWVTAPGLAIRMNARSGKVLDRLELGGTPAEAAAGPDGLAWITDKERSRVFRVDQKRATVVDSFPAGPGAYSLARAGGAMWVTSFAGSDVRRYDP